MEPNGDTYASLMIAAGFNAKALSTFMGHANVGITLDLYGHLMHEYVRTAGRSIPGHRGRRDAWPFVS